MIRPVALALAAGLLVPGPASAASEPVAVVANIAFHSDELLNLHHFLYAWAWRTRTQGRPLSQRLAAVPAAPFTAEERAAWDDAVRYYDRELASKDLNRGEGMADIKLALLLGKLDDAAIAPALRAALDSTLPIYRRHFWAEHDRVNRAWIADIAQRVESLSGDVVPALERLYAARWFATPARADIVWVGNWAGGYTTVDPTHATISSTHEASQGWAAVDVVFHEYSHILVEGLERKLTAALGDGATHHPVLWHAVQFYLTAETVRAALERRGVAYVPSSEGMFQRSWPEYRGPITGAWGPYLEGRGTMDEAIARMVAALPPAK